MVVDRGFWALTEVVRIVMCLMSNSAIPQSQRKNSRTASRALPRRTLRTWSSVTTVLQCYSAAVLQCYSVARHTFWKTVCRGMSWRLLRRSGSGE